MSKVMSQIDWQNDAAEVCPVFIIDAVGMAKEQRGEAVTNCAQCGWLIQDHPITVGKYRILHRQGLRAQASTTRSPFDSLDE